MTPNKNQLANKVKRDAELSQAKLEAFTLRLEKFLNRNLGPLLSELERGKYAPLEAMKAMSDLEDVLREAGLQSKLDEARGLFATEYAHAEELFQATTGKKALLSSVTREDLVAIEDNRIASAGRMVNQYLGDVQNYVLDQVLAGKKPTLPEVSETLTPKLISNLETELNTSLAGYNRIATRLKAEKLDIAHYWYAGPNDALTRPFCKERVGKVFTQNQIDKWDNETDLPANVYCGGYNCRHALVPIPQEEVADFRESLEEQ